MKLLSLSALVAVATLPTADCASKLHAVTNYGTKVLRRGKATDSTTPRRLHHKSKKYTAAPTMSVMPSTVPSPSPSMAPSVSVRPSSSPSVSPTSRPSTSPTAAPSSSPSISSMPSTSPTSQPTGSPSSSPTSMPTGSPSNQPSGKPSISSGPSSIPSISPTSSPTIDKVSGWKEVDGGIQEGCPVPAYMSDSNFAEASVKNITGSFIYAIVFDKVESGANEEEVIASYVHDLEMELQDFVFNDYVDCNSMVWEGGIRKLQDLDRPIGASNVPVDERSTEFVCSGTTKGRTCVPMNGQFTLLYTAEAAISPYEEEMKVLTAMMNAYKDGDLNSGNSNVSVEFYGKKGDPFSSQTGIVVPRSTAQDMAEGDQDNVSATGGVMIAASVLVLGLALFAGDRRRRNVRIEKNRAGGLTLLREDDQHDSDDGDYDLCKVQSGDGDIFEVVLPSESVKKSGMPFPMVLPDSDDSVDPQCYTCDVHRCTSATCQECDRSGEGVRFISVAQQSSQWYENSDVDFQSVRSYSTSNTVDL